MERRHNRTLYILFYVIFSVETWRILMGTAAMAVLIGPKLTSGGGYGVAAQCVIWIMILTVGYTVCNYPARFVSKGLQRLLTRNRA